MLHLVYARCVALSLRTLARKRRDADDAETHPVSLGRFEYPGKRRRFRASLSTF